MPVETMGGPQQSSINLSFNVNLTLPSSGQCDLRQVLSSFFGNVPGRQAIQAAAAQTPSNISSIAAAEPASTPSTTVSTPQPATLVPSEQSSSRDNDDHAFSTSMSQEVDEFVDLTGFESDHFDFRDDSNGSDSDPDFLQSSQTRKRKSLSLNRSVKRNSSASTSSNSSSSGLGNSSASTSGSSFASTSRSFASTSSDTSSASTSGSVQANLRAFMAGITSRARSSADSAGTSSGAGSSSRASTSAARLSTFSHVASFNASSTPEPAEESTEAQRALETAARLARCSVCLDNPINARLRRGHCFCSICLQVLKSQKKPCPKCRQAFRKWEPMLLG